MTNEISTNTHVMVDIETLATGRDAAILSIGAVRFNPMQALRNTNNINTEFEEGTTFFNVRIDLTKSPRELAGVMDASTVEWWLKQNDEARKALITGLRVDLNTALLQFAQFVDGAKVLWSNGPTFDETILRDAYTRAGFTFPLHYRTSRDLRTILEAAETFSGFRRPMISGTSRAHDALWDAKTQALNVIGAYNGLRRANVATA